MYMNKINLKIFGFNFIGYNFNLILNIFWKMNILNDILYEIVLENVLISDY